MRWNLNYGKSVLTFSGIILVLEFIGSKISANVVNSIAKSGFK